MVLFSVATPKLACSLSRCSQCVTESRLSGFTFADVTVFDISIEDLEMKDFVGFSYCPMVGLSECYTGMVFLLRIWSYMVRMIVLRYI